jgi:ribose 5-phosphate isomerase B
MKIALASDHRGFKLKSVLEKFLKEKGYEVMDFGTYTSEPCDYPDYIYPASVAVKQKRADRAIFICYTGIGSCIAANKVKGIRAALVSNIAAATLTRKHNDSNVLVLAAQALKIDYAKKIVSMWLKTEFEGGRHLRRINKIRDIEERENTGRTNQQYE